MKATPTHTSEPRLTDWSRDLDTLARRLRRCGVGVGSAVIGSGANVAMVAMVDNAS